MATRRVSVPWYEVLLALGYDEQDTPTDIRADGEGVHLAWGEEEE